MVHILLLFTATIVFTIPICACKPRQPSSNLHDQTMPPPIARLELDLPPRGSRSVFDVMTWQWAREQNATQPTVVPFPFSDLLTKISGPYKKLGVLVPKSRSLQKFASAPDYYRFPRILAVSTRHDVQRSPGFKVHRPGEIFIGYSERAEALEVISYNDAAGRFEFQIVKDYATGKTPKVFYAERKVCVACHQNQGPIFSPDPWSDTNANETISELIQATRPKDDVYEGIAFQQRRRDEALKLESYEFDELVRASEFLIGEAKAWYEGCGELDLIGQECRETLIRHAHSSSEFKVSQAVKDRLAVQWQNALGYRIPILSSIIPNIDTVSTHQVPASANPITKRRLETSQTLVLPDFNQDEVNHIPGARSLVSQTLQAISKLHDSMEKSSDPLAHHLKKTMTGDRDFNRYYDRQDVSIPQEFSRAQIHSVDSLALGLLQNANILKSTKVLSDLAATRLPDPQVAHISDKPAGLDISFDKPIGKFLHYCGTCHRGNGAGPAFLDGRTEAEITNNLRLVTTEVRSRLILTLKDSPLAMPPEKAPTLVRQLEAAPEHRNAMIQWLETK